MPEPELHEAPQASVADRVTPLAPSPRLTDLAISLRAVTPELEQAWRRLEQREWVSLNQSIDWCRAWTLAQGTELAAIVGALGTRIVFILPVEFARGTIGTIARWPGDRFNNTNTGLFDEALAGADADDIEHLRRSLQAAAGHRADLLVLDQIPLSWRGVAHPLAPLASIENQNHSFQLPLLDTMDATLKQLNAKARRKKFRVQCRRMEELGGYDHVQSTDPEEQAVLLDLFFRQKGTRLKATGLPDVFAPPATRDFFHRLLQVPPRADARPLAMHAIRLKGEHAGHIAAIAGISRKGSHVLCQFGSIDNSVAAEASPGEMLFWLLIEQNIAQGATMFDFGVGAQPYKRSWCSQETVQHDILVPLTPRGRLLKPLMMGKTAVKTRLKQHPRLYAAVQRWRQR